MDCVVNEQRFESMNFITKLFSYDAKISGKSNK